MSVNTSEDCVVIREVLSGRTEAFRALVERYFATVRLVALAKTGNVADAEDVAQETFIKAYETLGVLRNRERLAPWLVAIARNIAISLVRRRERERRNAEAYPIDPLVHPDHERRETLDAVARQVEALPESLREVVLLHYFEGLKCREIGERLDLNTNAVVKRLARGRDLLGDRLLREWGEGARPESAKLGVGRVMGAIVLLSRPDWGAQVAGVTSAAAQGASLTIGGIVVSKTILAGLALLLVVSTAALLLYGFYGATSRDTKGTRAAALGTSEMRYSDKAISSAEVSSEQPQEENMAKGARDDSVEGHTLIENATDSDPASGRTGVQALGALPLAVSPPELEPDEDEDKEKDAENVLIGYLEGRVTGHDRTTPVAGAVVSAQGKDASGMAQTDEGGAFRVEVHGPALAEDATEEQLFTVSASKASLLSDLQLRVPLNSSGIELFLTEPGAVRGIVVDASTEKPLPHFEARISRQRQGAEGIMGTFFPWTEFVSEEGQFELPTQDELGEVAVRAKGYKEEKLQLSLSRGDVAEGVVVALQPGAPFTGIVIDAASRAPVAGAAAGIVTGEVRQWWGIGEENFSIGAMTDQDGVFTLSEAVAGQPFDLIVWHEAYAPVFMTDLDAGEQHEVRLYLTPGGQLSGTVKRNGEPISGLRMWAGLSFGRPMEHTAEGSGMAVFLALSGTDAAGAFNFSKMPPGRYQVRVMDVNDATPLAKRYLVRRWVDINDGENTVVDFNIGSEGSVSGTITGAVDMGKVQLRLYDRRYPEQTLYSTAERHDSSAPDQSGFFEFPPVPEGSYFIRATILEPSERSAVTEFDIEAGVNTEIVLAFE